MIDTLINARWVYPVDDEFQELEHHSIAIERGRILDVLPTEIAEQKYSARHVVNRSTHAVIPGLINSHTHIAMSLFRGLADDLPLMDWLNEHIWPAEAKHINPEFIRLGTTLGIAEMLKSGTTCFNDMYFFPDEVAHTASKLGMRAAVGMIIVDFPSAWAHTADEYFEKGRQVSDEYRDDPLISTMFAPHAPYSVNNANFSRVIALANEMDKPIHVHLHETAHEIQESLSTYEQRPLQRMHELGLLSPNLLAVHMTQLTDEEIDLLAVNQVSVAHCPESNLKLASGFCPVGKLLEKGVNVSIGTDGAASNNDLDLLGEIRTAALLAKAVHQDATSLNAQTALKMLTINGANALNLGDEIGSIEQHKWADLCCIDLEHVNTQPVYNPLSHIIYAANSRQVSDVWVAGNQLLNQHQLTNIDERALINDVKNFHATF